MITKHYIYKVSQQNDEIIRRLEANQHVLDCRMPRPVERKVSHIAIFTDRDRVEHLVYVPHIEQINDHGNEYFKIHKLVLENDVVTVSNETKGGLLMIKRCGGLLPAVINHNNAGRAMGGFLSALIPIYQSEDMVGDRETYFYNVWQE